MVEKSPDRSRLTLLDDLGHVERETAGRVQPATELADLEQSQAFHLRQSHQQPGQDCQSSVNCRRLNVKYLIYFLILTIYPIVL